MPQQPHPPMHGPPGDTRTPTPQPGISRPRLLVLFGLIAGSTGSAHPEIDYPEFYQWLDEDKVQSVLLQGPSLEGELKAEETVEEQSTTRFHTVPPKDDAALLLLLREKNVRIADLKDPAFGFLVLMKKARAAGKRGMS